jgi:hypothetical protein
MMESDPNCSMDTFDEQCESQFLWRIGAELSGERRDVERKKLYEAG